MLGVQTPSVPDPPESFPAFLRRARQAARMKQFDLAWAAREHGAPDGITGSYISKLERSDDPKTVNPKRASARTMAAIAKALGEDPSGLACYRLAALREELDEGQRSERFGEAVSRLREIEAALSAQLSDLGSEVLPREPDGKTSESTSGRHPKRRSGPKHGSA